MVITGFDLQPGRQITAKYRVVEKLGSGLEGEVYKIEEVDTGIARAAKLFYPHRNINGRASRMLARKLHDLRDCPILVQYHHQESISFRRSAISVMISEYIDGEPLADFLDRQRGGYLPPFQACHLLYALATGVRDIHLRREYHGDIHLHNIIVSRYGLDFSLKLIDFHHWSSSRQENIREDVIDMIKVFYAALGGAKRYARQPAPVKEICSGLKRTLILKKFPSAMRLCEHLETMEWDDA